MPLTTLRQHPELRPRVTGGWGVAQEVGAPLRLTSRVSGKLLCPSRAGIKGFLTA